MTMVAFWSKVSLFNCILLDFVVIQLQFPFSRILSSDHDFNFVLQFNQVSRYKLFIFRVSSVRSMDCTEVTSLHSVQVFESSLVETEDGGMQESCSG